MGSLFGGKGPLTAVKDLTTTAVATLQTRLALVANEIQIEKNQILQQLSLALALGICLLVGVLMLIGLLVAVWWEQRVLVLGLFLAFFVALALYFLAALRRSREESTPMLEATLAELQKDLRQLKASTGHE